MADILYTPRYEDDLVRIYKFSYQKWGKTVAERTMAQIAEVEDRALSEPDFGKLDAKYHSPVYRYATIANGQTVFFHRSGDNVVMITAGYTGRGWNQIMQRIEPQIRQYLEQIEAK